MSLLVGDLSPAPAFARAAPFQLMAMPSSQVLSAVPSLLIPQLPPSPSRLSSLQQPEGACEHPNQVPSLLSPLPSRAPTSLGIKEYVLPGAHRPCMTCPHHLLALTPPPSLTLLQPHRRPGCFPNMSGSPAPGPLHGLSPWLTFSSPSGLVCKNMTLITAHPTMSPFALYSTADIPYILLTVCLSHWCQLEGGDRTCCVGAVSQYL